MLRAYTNIFNLIYLIKYGDKIMESHYCRLCHGFVGFDFDCEGCKLCEHQNNEEN